MDGENLTQVTADAFAPSNGHASKSCPSLGLVCLGILAAGQVGDDETFRASFPIGDVSRLMVTTCGTKRPLVELLPSRIRVIIEKASCDPRLCCIPGGGGGGGGKNVVLAVGLETPDALSPETIPFVSCMCVDWEFCCKFIRESPPANRRPGGEGGLSGT